MATITTGRHDGRAVTERPTFSRQTSVRIKIAADPIIIWKLLTNSSDMPRWNPTIVSIEGDIKSGASIRLKSTLDAKRMFKLKVKEFEPAKRLVWGDANGNRVFTLKQIEDGLVQFEMNEKIGGLMFPLYAKYIPPFDKAFEDFAASLKKEAELIQQ